MCGEQGFKTVYDTVQQVKCKGKGFSLIFSRVLMLRYLVLQDIQNTVFVPHPYGIRPGGTITEQSYKFPVCANAGVLFSLDILSLVCDKHIETRFPLQQFRFWSITQPCHVSVHGAIRTKTQPGIRFSQSFHLDQVPLFSDFNHLFELLGPCFAPYSSSAFYILELI